MISVFNKKRSLLLYTARGVTLIELLVVIFIMSMLIALVAPSMINRIDKVKTEGEYRRLIQALKNTSIQASTRAQRVEISLSANQLIARTGFGEEKLISFSYLEFSEQHFFFNRYGFAEQDSVELTMANQKHRTIYLNQLIQYGQ